jgi:DNA invertase Pin-like site-specific DNA recombinase
MKAAFYIRANDTQRIAQQVFRLYSEALNKGYEVALKHIYTDSGSANKPDRNGLEALLFDAHQGKFDKLLVVSYDRLARRMTDMKEINRALDISNVSLEVVN